MAADHKVRLAAVSDVVATKVELGTVHLITASTGLDMPDADLEAFCKSIRRLEYAKKDMVA